MNEKPIYKDASFPVEKRVEDLLSRMTLEEKAAQLCGDLAYSFIENGELSREKLKENYPYGHGRITQYSLTGIVSQEYIAKLTNELQDYFVNETRLGIPVALQSETFAVILLPEVRFSRLRLIWGQHGIQHLLKK